MRIGAIEAGGTKFICGVGNEQGEILDRISFPTEAPEQTLQQAVAFFQDKGVEAIGIGSFGPVPPDLGDNAGLAGALALGIEAASLPI